MKNNIEKRLIDLIKENLYENGTINNSDALHELGFDSLDIIELECIIESEFKIKMNEDEIMISDSITEIAKKIENKL